MTDSLILIHRRWLGSKPSRHYHPEVQHFLEASRAEKAEAEADRRARGREHKLDQNLTEHRRFSLSTSDPERGSFLARFKARIVRSLDERHEEDVDTKD